MNARRRTDAAAAAAGIHAFVPGEGGNRNGLDFAARGTRAINSFFRTRFLWDSGEKLDRRLHTSVGWGTMLAAVKLHLQCPCSI